jgi:hypothetical protein
MTALSFVPDHAHAAWVGVSGARVSSVFAWPGANDTRVAIVISGGTLMGTSTPAGSYNLYINTSLGGGKEAVSMALAAYLSGKPITAEFNNSTTSTIGGGSTPFIRLDILSVVP